MANLEITGDNASEVLRCARQQVEAAVRNLTVPCKLTPELAQIPVAGLFVTLRNRGKLRACMGNWHADDPGRLEKSLATAARSAATRDQRSTPILETELPELSIEVSVLYNPCPVQAVGDARIEAVEAGRHGLLLEDSRRRGLLLPQVASERQWDAKTFLEHTALKAGFTKNAWRKAAIDLTTFEALKLAE